jgi:hypothetical protein
MKMVGRVVSCRGCSATLKAKLLGIGIKARVVVKTARLIVKTARQPEAMRSTRRRN